jgi:tetratricopeptide (TPR) repeat protein
VTYFEQALQALAHLPEPGDTRVLALELRLGVESVLTQLGEHRRRLALLGEAEALARALDDRSRLVRVLDKTAQLLRAMVDYDGAMAAGRQALELAAALGDHPLQMQATYRLGQVYNAIGDFSRAAQVLRQSVEATDRESGTPSTSLQSRFPAWLALTLGELGAFAEGRRHGEEALRLAMLEGEGTALIRAHRCLGSLYLAQGDLEHATRMLDQGLTRCLASGNLDDLRPIAAALGFAYALQGRIAEGRAFVEEAISVSLRTGQPTGQGRRVAWLSEVCRLAGHREEAWQHAHQALGLARQQKARGEEALTLHQLGVVQAHADLPDAAQAEAYYQQALALAEALGMRPLQAHCHLGLGTLYAKIGRPEPARTALATAIERYRAWDMNFWLPQAEVTLAQVEGR